MVFIATTRLHRGGFLLIFYREILASLSRGDAPGRGCPPFSRKIATAVFVGLIAASFTGCALKRSGYDVPDVPLPGQYRNSPADESPSQEPAPTEAAAPPASPNPVVDVGMVEWWRSFGNAELSALIDRGIANNSDVRIATLKIAQVKARADQVRADQRPSITGGAGETIQVPGGQVASVPVGQADRTTQKLYQASVRGNWRIDLWGEQSALAESAGLQVWQAVFERDNVQRSMVTNLASSYIEYLSLNDRLRIAQEADTVLSGVLATIEKRIEAGDATLIELEQQKATIFSVRATIPNLEQQREDAIASIAFLVGTVPGSLSLSADGLHSLLLPNVIPALPSSLILRRPDVRMVEARLLAADADVDVARARILPALDLSGQMGYSSLAMSGLFQPLSLFWNAIANLTVSIFDSGKLSSQKDQAKAVHEEMVENYARTIYQAVREVESALAAIRLTAKRFDAQQEATAAAQRAWDSSNEVYAVGGLDHLTLLDAGRTYLRYLDDYERIKMDRYRGYVSLFQALGGGADFGQVIPGKGVRPTPVRNKFSGAASVSAVKKISSAEGVEWAAGQTVVGGGGWQVERFWQVELPGLYHRVAIGPTWRDLRARYPKLMDGRIVRPRLSGRVEDSVDGQAAWYRLYVAKFENPVAAEAFCAALKAAYQRCRVVSSTSDDTVVAVPGSVQAGDVKPKAVVLPLAIEKTLSIVRNEDVDPPVKSLQPVEKRQVVALGEAADQLAEPLPMLDASKEKIAHSVQPEASSRLDEKIPAIVRSENVDPPTKLLPPQVEKRPVAASGEVADRIAKPLPMPDASKEKMAYTIQLGTFSNLENAAISYAFWRDRKLDAYVSEFKDSDGQNWYAVRTGIFLQRRDASVAAASLRQKESANAVMLPIMVDKSGKPFALAAGDLRLPSAMTTLAVLPEPPEAPVAVPERNQSGAVLPDGGKEHFAYSVQLGAFSVLENAAVSYSFWRNKGYEVFIAEIKGIDGRIWYAVRTGAHQRRDDALASALFFGRGEDVPVVVVMTAVDQSGLPKAIDPGKSLQTSATDQHRPAAAVPAAKQDVRGGGKKAATPKGVFKGNQAYSIQLGVFSSLENAAKSLSAWQARGYEAYVCEVDDVVKPIRFAVRTGAFPTRHEAVVLLRLLQRKESVRAMLVPAVLDRFGQVAVIDVTEFNHLAGAEN